MMAGLGLAPPQFAVLLEALGFRVVDGPELAFAKKARAARHIPDTSPAMEARARPFARLGELMGG
jgi:hypothetical protein